MTTTRFEADLRILQNTPINQAQQNLFTPVTNSSQGNASSNNNSTTPLGAGATFTGTGEQNNLSDFMISCFTDAPGTIFADFSNDGTNWDSTFPPTGFQVTAGIHEFHVGTKGPRFIRVRYVNGSTAQTVLRLYTYFGSFDQGNLPLNSTVAQDADAKVVRNLSEEISITEGKMGGYTSRPKAGKNSDIDSGSVPEDIWEGSGVYNGFPASADTIDVVSDDANDTAAGTGARSVRFVGLDADYNVQAETVTLNGTTPVTTTTTWLRVHTMRVVSAGSGGENVGTISLSHTSDATVIFIQMQPGRNQTNMAGFTIPAGQTGYIKRITGSLRGGASATVDGALRIRNFGEVFRLRRPFTIGVQARLDEVITFGLRLPEKSDIIPRITACSANNVDCLVGYDLLLVENV